MYCSWYSSLTPCSCYANVCLKQDEQWILLNLFRHRWMWTVCDSRLTEVLMTGMKSSSRSMVRSCDLVPVITRHLSQIDDHFSVFHCQPHSSYNYIEYILKKEKVALKLFEQNTGFALKKSSKFLVRDGEHRVFVFKQRVNQLGVISPMSWFVRCFWTRTISSLVLWQQQLVPMIQHVSSLSTQTNRIGSENSWIPLRISGQVNRFFLSHSISYLDLTCSVLLSVHPDKWSWN